MFIANGILSYNIKRDLEDTVGLLDVSRFNQVFNAQTILVGLHRCRRWSRDSHTTIPKFLKLILICAGLGA
jgi:hypothetical protein